MFRPTWSSETSPCGTDATGSPIPLAVLEQGRVVAMSRAARHAGVRLGMKRGGVLTVAAQAVLHERDLLREADAWQGVALALMQYTPQVALLDWARASQQAGSTPAQNQMQGVAWGQAGAAIDAPLIVADISASLRLFGGIRALRRRIRATLAASGLTARLSLAPTGTAAALLARAGGMTVLHPMAMPEEACVSIGIRRTPRSLDRILGRLPLPFLPEAQAHVESLHGLGCLTLDDLRRLPRAGIKRRCGEALVGALDRALGLAEEGFQWLTTPEQFDQQQALPDRADDTSLIFAGATTLIGRLTGWLASRQWAVTRFMLLLEHERGREARPPTSIEIALAEPTWHDSHLLRLVRERLAKTSLEAHVIAVRLQATAVEPAKPLSNSLFPEPAGSPADHRRLIELLQARLGIDNVLQCHDREDYRPERANQWGRRDPRGAPESGSKGRAGAPALSIVKAGNLAEAARARIAQHTPRPVWLLDTPLPLMTRRHRPFYGSSLRLVSPGERIESGWWDDAVVTRDYFVAQADDHTCYWIFRERLGRKAKTRADEQADGQIDEPAEVRADGPDTNRSNGRPSDARPSGRDAMADTASAEEAHWFLHGFFG